MTTRISLLLALRRIKKCEVADLRFFFGGFTCSMQGDWFEFSGLKKIYDSSGRR